MQRRRKRRTRRRWDEARKLVQEFERSGLSQVAFCDRAGIHASSLARWIRRAREERADAAPKLVPVRVVESENRARETTEPFEIVLRNGRRLCVPAAFDEETLTRLVRTLEGC